MLADEARKMQDSYRQRMDARGLSVDISPEDYVTWWERHLLGKG